MSKKIRIVIVDDIEEVTEYFRGIFAKESDLEVVGTARNVDNALQLIDQLRPDLVLTDIQMEKKDSGIEIVKHVNDHHEGMRTIVLTIHEEDELLFQAYAEGAVDYIVKTSSIVDIINSIRSVHANQLSLRPQVAQKILREFARLKKEKNALISSLNVMTKLTNGQYEILQAVYNGKSYRQIAAERYVKEVTIRTQVNKMLKKFNLKRMKDLVAVMKGLDIFETFK